MNLDSLTLWLTQHPQWILAVIAFLSLIESVALLGLVTPGIGLMFVVAGLAGSAGIPLWLVITVSGAAATLGDVASFYAGRHFHGPITRLGVLQRHPQWLARAEAFVRRYGVAGIGAGRFIGALRPFLPMMAGALELRALHFWLVELITAPLWGALYMTPGHAAAGLAQHGERMNSMGAVWWGLWAIALVIAEVIVRHSMTIRSPAQTRRLLHLWLGGLVLAFAGLYLLVTQGHAHDFNTRASLQWITLRSEALDPLVVALTGLGEFQPMITWAIAIAVLLLVQGCWGATGLWLAFVIAGDRLFKGLKLHTGIARPALVHDIPAGNSFPSGHATMSMLFAGLLAVIAWPRLGPTGRRTAAMLVATWAFWQGSSRLYLGVHWSLDVITGLVLGGTLVTLAALARQHRPMRTPWPPGLLIISVLVLAAMEAQRIVPTLDEALSHYAVALALR